MKNLIRVFLSRLSVETGKDKGFFIFRIGSTAVSWVIKIIIFAFIGRNAGMTLKELIIGLLIGAIVWQIVISPRIRPYLLTTAAILAILMTFKGSLF